MPVSRFLHLLEDASLVVNRIDAERPRSSLGARFNVRRSTQTRYMQTFDYMGVKNEDIEVTDRHDMTRVLGRVAVSRTET